MPSPTLMSAHASLQEFFATQTTLADNFRIQQLQRLKTTIQKYEAELLQALQRDLHKSAFEGYTSEIGFVYSEINDAIKNLRRWMKPQRVKTPWLHWPSRSKIHAQPKGVVLIIAPWNYPVQLLFSPLVGAIAAGNCVMLKPSEAASATEKVIAKTIAEAFPQKYCAVVTGDASVAQELLGLKFDHIFFTGSTIIGQQVLRAAAEHLTPVTLELGGKSPCIVDATANIDLSARRIAWGKFYNAGQSCVAPDYLLVHRQIKDQLVEKLKHTIENFFGPQTQNSPDYGRIISRRHFDRLTELLKNQSILVGGHNDAETLYIAPTIIDCQHMDNPLMREEIFGPILPILTYNSRDEIPALIAQRPTPLACYIFTSEQNFAARIIREVKFGGGCVNNTLIHVANQHLPFGGVGYSGMGAYHGKASFDVFSHRQSIVYTPWMFDLWLKYPPYRGRLKLIRKLLR